MNRILKLALILLCLTRLSSARNDDQEKAKCSYFGEPHLIPFATPSNPVQNQYVCRPVGQEVLIQNSYLEIVVTIAATGNHPIVKYDLTVFPDGSYPDPCVITDILSSLSPPPSCPPTSAATILVSGSSLHLSHLTQDIQIDIDNQGRCFDIYITQPSWLVGESKGVCVEWRCALEMSPAGRKKRQTDPIITNIIDIFVRSARSQALGPIDENVVRSRMVGSTYDMSATFDQRYARTIALSVIRASVSQHEDEPNYNDYWRRAVAAAEVAICQANEQVNELIAPPGSICKDVEGERVCFEPINNNGQCSRRRRK